MFAVERHNLIYYTGLVQIIIGVAKIPEKVALGQNWEKART